MQRTCTTDGCNRKHVAKGMCGTHYNESRYTKEQRHQKIEMTCTQCGIKIMKWPSGKRKPYCSWECQRAHQMGTLWATKTRRLAGVVVLHPSPSPRPVRAPTPSPRLGQRRYFAGFCQMCKTGYISLDTSKTCSPECAEGKRLEDKAQGRQRRRASERNAYVATVVRLQIFERDRWRCQICRHLVARDKQAPHPLSPTIDHITPLSKGGTHEPANVRLACFACNCKRGDRGVEEQLFLIG